MMKLLETKIGSKVKFRILDSYNQNIHFGKYIKLDFNGLIVIEAEREVMGKIYKEYFDLDEVELVS